MNGRSCGPPGRRPPPRPATTTRASSTRATHWCSSAASATASASPRRWSCSPTWHVSGRRLRAGRPCSARLPARWRDAGAVRANYPPYFRDSASTERALRRRLGDAAFGRAFDYGAALTEDESIGFALHGIVETRTRTAVPLAARSILTPRETEVASLVADGETNRSIARRLFVSIRTVETHVQNALVKLGLRSRTELAVWFREQPETARPEGAA
ncbi:helix-turn-helix transcriptional regulator [Leifsonia virtsii]|uniref:Response regulator transcription factor n=1 Tax=Leifsonia virtsii TaxID=3035915 RepID=A0ABT8IZI9_9MICO|nr:response regulator transcription factor [Leifsonia virtsii]MDN4598224.1 response regulator transcription factor [Leifsonia virtsii]